MSGCHNAIDDVSIHSISELKELVFLDISYSKMLTDKSLVCFKEKQNWGLQTLIINCVERISS